MLKIQEFISAAEKAIERPDGTRDLAQDALLHAVKHLADMQVGLIRSQLEKLQLKDGDGLVVKLGDPTIGWIPGPEQQDRMLKLVTTWVSELGYDVPVLVYHYGAEFEVLRTAEYRRREDAWMDLETRVLTAGEPVQFGDWRKHDTSGVWHKLEGTFGGHVVTEEEAAKGKFRRRKEL